MPFGYHHDTFNYQGKAKSNEWLQGKEKKRERERERELQELWNVIKDKSVLLGKDKTTNTKCQLVLRFKFS